MMEDHDMAYRAWKERGIRARVLVHVDAHIDFGWIPEMDFDEMARSSAEGSAPLREGPLLNPFLLSRKKMVDIGNYICPAMRDGMVKKFYWVVPDENLRSARGRKHILKSLRHLLAVKRHAGGRPEIRKDRICCRICDRDVVVCGLGGLPQISEPALLDIDVDFMLTKFIWDDLNPERFPWIYPQELYEKLVARISEIDILTIAYSVEGGFTPLKFKYLGDELRFLFQAEPSSGRRKAMACKKKALACEKEKRPGDAASAYEEALRMDDTDASAYFSLSLLHLAMGAGETQKAARFYREALARDRSYATRYNNYGILYLRYNRLKRAESEYGKFLHVADNAAPVYNGLGVIALARRRYAQAQDFFDQCLALDKGYPEARLGKGIARFKTAQLAEAEDLFCGLKKDYPDDAQVHWWLGRIAQKRGDISCAIDSYKEAVLRGGEGPFVHCVLARLYVLKGFYYRALEELKSFFQSLRAVF